MVREHVDHERRNPAHLDEGARIGVAQPVRRGHDKLSLAGLFVELLLLALDQMHDRASNMRTLPECSAKGARLVLQRTRAVDV